MERLKKISTLVIVMLVLVLLGGSVNAAGLTLKTIAEKSEVTVGDEFKVTVDWTEGMQAVDFSLLYDSDKLEYVKSDLGASNTNNTGDKVIVSWFSDNDTDKTKVEFIFKAIKEGTVNLSSNVEGAFATGELVSPDSYDVTTTSVTIKAKEVVQEPVETTPEEEKPETTPEEEKPETTPEEEKPETTPEEKPETTPEEEKPSTEPEKKPTKIPHAGTGTDLVIGIVALSVIIIFAYIQLKRYKEI